METKIINLDTAFGAYLQCAACSSVDEDGEPLDAYQFSDKAEKELREEFEKAIADFEENAFPELETYLREFDSAAFGHDFWLTRNHHGAGFWDQGIHGIKKLTEISHSYGGCELYLNPDTLEIEVY